MKTYDNITNILLLIDKSNNVKDCFTQELSVVQGRTCHISEWQMVKIATNLYYHRVHINVKIVCTCKYTKSFAGKWIFFLYIIQGCDWNITKTWKSGFLSYIKHALNDKNSAWKTQKSTDLLKNHIPDYCITVSQDTIFGIPGVNTVSDMNVPLGIETKIFSTYKQWQRSFWPLNLVNLTSDLFFQVQCWPLRSWLFHRSCWPLILVLSKSL